MLDRNAIPGRAASLIVALFLCACEVDGDSTPSHTPMTGGAPFAGYDELSVQIQAALEEDACASMYRVNAVEIDRARLTHAEAIVDVDAIASLVATDKLSDFDNGVCNTLAWRRRADSFRRMPPGALVPFSVTARFTKAESTWRLQSMRLAD